MVPLLTDLAFPSSPRLAVGGGGVDYPCLPCLDALPSGNPALVVLPHYRCTLPYFPCGLYTQLTVGSVTDVGTFCWATCLASLANFPLQRPLPLAPAFPCPGSFVPLPAAPPLPTRACLTPLIGCVLVPDDSLVDDVATGRCLIGRCCGYAGRLPCLIRLPLIR